jgi:hypothetical protein
MNSQSDLPGVYDFAETDQDRQVCSTCCQLACAWGVRSPHPASRLTGCRRCGRRSLRAVSDPLLVAEIDLDLAPSSGDEISRLVARLISH